MRKKIKWKWILLPLFLMLLVIVTIVVAFSILIGAIMGGVENTNSSSSVGAASRSIPVTIEGTYDGRSGMISITGEALFIKNIVINGTSSSFSGKTKKETWISMEVPGPPAQLNEFAWMPQFNQSFYEKPLDRNSAQYKLNQSDACYDDAEGFRRYGDYYMVAMGTYYGRTGDILEITFTNGKKIPVILGDSKANNHTDAKNQYHNINANHNVLEFIMASNSPSVTSKNAKAIYQFGTIKTIKKKNGFSADIKGSIKGSTVTLSGVVDGKPFNGTASYAHGKIKGEGLVGSLSDGTVGEGVDDMLKWCNTICADNKYGYSMLRRTCYTCKKNTHDYDCSSFVTAALAHGYGSKVFSSYCRAWPCTTFNLAVPLKIAGFSNKGNLAASQLKPGDILLEPSSHVEIYAGNGMAYGAHWDYDGVPGDGNGKEVSKDNVSHFYTQVWRPPTKPNKQ